MPSRASWPFVLLVVAARPAAAQQALTPAERQRLAAAVWAEAHYNYAGQDRVRADWDSALVQVLSAAAGRQSDFLFYRRLRRFVALLPDGQAAILPPASLASRLARPPVALRAVDGRPFIVDYADNEETRIARPERLAEVVGVQGMPVERWIRDSVLPEIAGGTADARWTLAVERLLEGERGSAVQIQLRLPGVDLRGASLTRTIPATDRWPFDPPAFERSMLPESVAVVRIASFADPDVGKEFDRAFPDFAGLRGLILDLRDNRGAGGGRETGYRLLARLTERPFVTSRWEAALYRPIHREEQQPDSSFIWVTVPADTISPRRDLPGFSGPVVVLSSSATGGSAEDVLVAFRNARRGMIVGEASAGGTGQVAILSLFKDWRLRLTVTREEWPDGREINGEGVRPDVEVRLKAGDFLAGRDPVLDRAREWIADQRQGSRAPP